MSKLPEFLKLALLAGAGVFAWLSWPVSIWLFLAFIAHWMLRTATDRLKRARKQGRYSLLRTVAEALAKSLAQAIAYFGFGVFLVAIAQIALLAVSRSIDPSNVKSIEESLSWSFRALTQVFSFHNFLVAMIGLALVAVLVPRNNVIGRFLTVRKWVTKLSLVLLGVTSFTFFSAVQGKNADAEWRRIEQYKARVTLKNIDDDIRDVTAATWVEDEVRRLDSAKRQEFARFFQTVRVSKFPTEIARAAAVELGRAAPRASSGPVRPAPPDDVINLARERRYFELETGDYIGSEQPTLAEFRSANERLSLHALRLRTVRTTAIELASAALAELRQSRTSNLSQPSWKKSSERLPRHPLPRPCQPGLPMRAAPGTG
jgi:hypothetical protein